MNVPALFLSAFLGVLVPAETPNFTSRVQCKKADVLIGPDNDSLPWVHEYPILRIGEASHFNEALIHENFRISDSIHGYAEFGAANRDRCSGAVDSVWIWLPAEMVDSYSNAAQQDFEQVAKRIGRTKVFQ
jgi:hypothetical protein